MDALPLVAVAGTSHKSRRCRPARLATVARSPDASVGMMVNADGGAGRMLEALMPGEHGDALEDPVGGAGPA